MGEKTSKPAAKTSDKPETHGNIYEALSAFQGELTPMDRNGRVKYQTSKGEIDFNYTTLDKILKTIYPLLKKHGLSIRHEVTGEKEKAVEAIMTHSTTKVVTHWKKTKRQFEETIEESEEPHQVEENVVRSGAVKITMGGDMKEVGAAITYARRYTLTMALGISSEEDKDAALSEASAKNAKKFAYGRAETGIKNAKTITDLEKATNILKQDMKMLKDGRAPQLGLNQEEYDELMMLAEVKEKELKEDNQSQ